MYEEMRKRDAEALLRLSGSYTKKDVRKAYLALARVYCPYMLSEGYIKIAAERIVAELSDARMLLEEEFELSERETLNCEDIQIDPELEPTLRDIEVAYRNYVVDAKARPLYQNSYGDPYQKQPGEGMWKFIDIALLVVKILCLVLIVAILVVPYALEGLGIVPILVLLLIAIAAEVYGRHHRRRGIEMGFTDKEPMSFQKVFSKFGRR